MGRDRAAAAGRCGALDRRREQAAQLPGSPARSAPANGPRSGCRRAPIGGAARRRAVWSARSTLGQPSRAGFEIVDADQPLVALRAMPSARRRSAARRRQIGRDQAPHPRRASARASAAARSGRPRRNWLRARWTMRSTSSTPASGANSRSARSCSPSSSTQTASLASKVGCGPAAARARAIASSAASKRPAWIRVMISSRHRKTSRRRRRQRALERVGHAVALAGRAAQAGQIGVARDPSRIGAQQAVEPRDRRRQPLLGAGSPRSGRAGPNRAAPAAARARTASTAGSPASSATRARRWAMPKSSGPSAAASAQQANAGARSPSARWSRPPTCQSRASRGWTARGGRERRQRRFLPAGFRARPCRRDRRRRRRWDRSCFITHLLGPGREDRQHRRELVAIALPAAGGAAVDRLGDLGVAGGADIAAPAPPAPGCRAPWGPRAGRGSRAAARISPSRSATMRS